MYNWWLIWSFVNSRDFTGLLLSMASSVTTSTGIVNSSVGVFSGSGVRQRVPRGDFTGLIFSMSSSIFVVSVCAFYNSFSPTHTNQICLGGFVDTHLFDHCARNNREGTVTYLQHYLSARTHKVIVTKFLIEAHKYLISSNSLCLLIDHAL